MKSKNNLRHGGWVACVDLESVLIPELWPALGKALREPDLLLTTRDIADKKKLNDLRLRGLKNKKVTLQQIEKIISKISPLPGAAAFLQWLQTQMSVIIVSDCYRGLAMPLLKKLRDPAILSHEWIVKNGKLVALPLRQTGDTKKPVVQNLQKMGFHVFALGDSLNDLGMLKTADKACWFCPSETAYKKGSAIPVARSYAEVKKVLAKR